MAKTPSTTNLGSYPFWNALVSTSFALLSIGLLALLSLHLRQAARVVRNNLRLNIYLKHEVTPAQRDALQAILQQAPYIAHTGPGPALQFVSKATAAKQFVEATGEAFDQVLTNNPLHDMYVVQLAPAYQRHQQLQELQHQLTALPGVFEVTYVENSITTINRHFARLGLSLTLIAALLCLAASLLIHNTLKLALYSQRFLLHSMQLVGARPQFIHLPYLLRAALIGLVAGLAADNGLLALLGWGNQQYPDLAQLQHPSQVALVLLGTVLLGVGLCTFSTYRAINKYLAVTLDELY